MHGNMHPMHMAQWLSARTNTAFLFKDWSTGNLTGLISALLASVVIAMFYEGVSYYGLVRQTVNKERMRSSTVKKSSKIFQHTHKTFLHMLQVTIGYVLMLCVMTYNIWMLVSVAVGAGIGHFLVRPLVVFIVFKDTDNYYINKSPEGNKLLPRVPSAKSGNGCDSIETGRSNIRPKSYKMLNTKFQAKINEENEESENLIDNKERMENNEKDRNASISYKTPKRLDGLLRETDSLRAIRNYKTDDSDLSKMSEINESSLSRSNTSGMPRQNESAQQSYNKYIKSKENRKDSIESIQTTNDTDAGKYIVKYNSKVNIKANSSEVSIVERDRDNNRYDNLWNKHC